MSMITQRWKYYERTKRTKRTKRTNEANRTLIGARRSFCAFLEFPAKKRERKPKKENEATKPQGSPEGRWRREKKPNIDDDPAVVSFLMELLLRPLLLECMSYLDQESLRQVCVLSTEFEDIVHNDPLM